MSVILENTDTLDSVILKPIERFPYNNHEICAKIYQILYYKLGHMDSATVIAICNQICTL